MSSRLGILASPMPDVCSKHSDRAATGVCKQCDSSSCSLCMLDVDGSIYCSLLCFTEQSLETKRKTLRDPALPPPTGVAPPAGDAGSAAEILSPEPAAAPPSAGPPSSTRAEPPPGDDSFEDVWSRIENPEPRESEPSKIASPEEEAAPTADPLANIGLDATPGSIPKMPPEEQLEAMNNVEDLFKKFGGSAPAPEPKFVDTSRPDVPAATDADSFNDASIVMPAAAADGPAIQDDSSILTPAAGGDEGTSILELNSLKRDDGTSVLDMGTIPKRTADPSEDNIGSSALMSSLKADPTSILGIQAIQKPEGAGERMPFVIPDSDGMEPPVPATPEDMPAGPRLSSLADAPGSETPLPMILPGTRRSTIQATCVFHADTPAVVLCSACGDPICTMCVSDEAHGGRCTPRCRRDDPMRRRSKAFGILVGATAAVVLLGIVWLILAGNKEEPKPEPKLAIAIPEPPKPETPKPEPPKPEPPKPEPPKPPPPPP